MSTLSPAVHRTILAVDVEAFGDRRRTNRDQVAVREGLYGALGEAFAGSGISWEHCYQEDRGDGVLVLISPDVPKHVVAARLPVQLAAALRRHNGASPAQICIRLRVAVHAGEVHHDEYGVAGAAINVTFRLLEADAVRSALVASPGVVALIASDWFFEEVIRHDPASSPAAYRRMWVAVKETQTEAWVALPDHPFLPGDDADVVVTHGRSGHLGDLPAELTSFIDREAEVAIVKRLLTQSRLVTLTGPGGVGKTRIALRVATESGGDGAFTDGVCLVELSALQDTELLTYTVAAALGLPEQTARPAIDVLVDYLHGRRILLVLDTCEHVIDACAMLADVLLRGTANVRVLTTSRQPLNSVGEHVLAIMPLPVPDVDAAPFGENQDALTLFRDRAAAAVPGFVVTETNRAAVAAVCRRLDGIPLAIELAVVRLRALSVEQMVSLLDDRFRMLTGTVRTPLPRHQTLQTAIGWSHELCAPEERLLWARLSVFADDFDLAAAEQVCAGGDLVGHRVFGDLISLVDKSIVSRVETGVGTRYRLLDTIREYGRERLAELGEERKLRRRHRDFYLNMTRQYDAEWLSSGQILWCRRLSQEHPNLRMALEFCFSADGEVENGLVMATSLWGYWLISARYSEARYWLDQALQQVGDPAPLRARARYC
jgi:predicted ATPase